MTDLHVAIAAAVGFGVLLAVIEVAFRAKATRPLRSIGGIAFVFYCLILCIGNVATTIAAVQVVDRSAPQLPFHWFWYAFVGVFGFEAIIRNLNVTLFDRGILSIGSWIERAREMAVASAVRIEADGKRRRAWELAERFRSEPDAVLKAYALTHLGSARLTELQKSATKSGADPTLRLALALAYDILDKAEAFAPDAAGSQRADPGNAKPPVVTDSSEPSD